MPKAGPKPRPIKERFEENINKDGPVQPHMDTACWEWTASKYHNGYGQFGPYHGRTQRAHRVSWELYRGPIPDGMLVLHECDNKPCVRPTHLFLGIQKENIQDMIQKGRAYFPGPGSQNGQAKLTESEVLEIRDLYQSDQFNQVELGSRFGVAPNSVSRIVNRNSWTHI